MIEDLPAPLLRLKILIWIQSAIGVALALSLFAALTNGNEPLAIGLLVCIVLWMVGFGPIRRKAAEIQPEDRVAPTGLPKWVPIAVGIGQVFTPIWLLFGSFALLILPAGFVVLVTIAFRWAVSERLNVPVHEKTWRGLLQALGIGFVWNVTCLMLFVMAVGG